MASIRKRSSTQRANYWRVLIQWRTNIFASPVLAEFRIPQQFDAAAEFVKPEDMYKYVRISAE
ncbi:MAG: hypothetical protein RLO19_23280 [Coleofasciculus sp. G2-EDA-02]